jgi:hypothetical protein
MKHVKLFENFQKDDPIYVIDLKEVFPEVYDQETLEIYHDDSQKDYYGEGEAKLHVYKFTGDLPDTENLFGTYIDPSFHEKEYKFKLDVETVDQLHYGNTSVIYMGVEDPSESGIIGWFGELLDDSSRDYLSW